MKLHQLVASHKVIKQTAYAELTAAHQKCQKPTLFDGTTRVYTKLFDEDTDQPAEKKRVQVTATDSMKVLANSTAQIFDITAQIDEANMVARADVVVDGETILTGIPAMTLLFLEKQLADVRKYVSTIPILDDAETWNYDEITQLHVSALPMRTKSTKKVAKPIILAQATEHHPAQTQLVTLDEVVGYWDTTKTSGAMPGAQRAKILKRVDELLVAVKVAREEANSIEVAKKRNIGGLVFSFLMS